MRQQSALWLSMLQNKEFRLGNVATFAPERCLIAKGRKELSRHITEGHLAGVEDEGEARVFIWTVQQLAVPTEIQPAVCADRVAIIWCEVQA